MLLEYNLADNTLAFAFEGPMDAKTINELRSQIEAKLEVHERINIYLEDRSVHYFTLYSVFMGVVYPLQNHNRFAKVAMVTNRSWIHLLSGINNYLVSADIKNYKTEERIDAMSWIME